VTQNTRRHNPHDVSESLRENDRQPSMRTEYSTVRRQKISPMCPWPSYSWEGVFGIYFTHRPSTISMPYPIRFDKSVGIYIMSQLFRPWHILILIHPALFAVLGPTSKTSRSLWEPVVSAGYAMSIMSTTMRPLCVLGTPACPQCEETGLESNGAFLTCATCGMAITQQALLREIIERRSLLEMP
jgi:hypothetical protein